MILRLYKLLMVAGTPFLHLLLWYRCRKGKESLKRLAERRGITSQARPDGPLLWIHAASVGEAQSTLILIDRLQAHNPDISLLVTTGTVTSAALMEKRLPPQAIHQFYPVDHPHWVRRFLNHWRPSLAFWTESELWPHMLGELRGKNIPVILMNGRLSDKSFRRWQKLAPESKQLMDTFDLILTQTQNDAEMYQKLGGANVKVGGNLKYSAAPLPYDENALTLLQESIKGRPLWLYASTHDGEEDMACRIHKTLKKTWPNLLTVIVPRHPERGGAVKASCKLYNLKASQRSKGHTTPRSEDDLYIADTIGELGLFYRIAPIACIGRSFSNDGGGGHNPIEAAQLECAVLHGPNVQNLQKIFDDMDNAEASLCLRDEEHFLACLTELLTNEAKQKQWQDKARLYAEDKAKTVDNIMKTVVPWLENNGLMHQRESKACA